MLKIAAFAPMPSASSSTAVTVKPGDLRSSRSPKRRSCAACSMAASPAASRPCSAYFSALPNSMQARFWASAASIPRSSNVFARSATWAANSAFISSCFRFRICSSPGPRASRPPKRGAKLRGGLLASGLQRVELGFAVVLRRAPARREPAAPDQAVERGIQRALLDQQRPARDLLNAQQHPVAVQLAQRHRLEDEQVQRARKDLRLGVHGLLLNH